MKCTTCGSVDIVGLSHLCVRNVASTTKIHYTSTRAEYEKFFFSLDPTMFIDGRVQYEMTREWVHVQSGGNVQVVKKEAQTYHSLASLLTEYFPAVPKLTDTFDQSQDTCCEGETIGSKELTVHTKRDKDASTVHRRLPPFVTRRVTIPVDHDHYILIEEARWPGCSRMQRLHVYTSFVCVLPRDKKRQKSLTKIFGAHVPSRPIMDEFIREHAAHCPSFTASGKRRPLTVLINILFFQGVRGRSLRRIDSSTYDTWVNS